jgi:predicted Zn-dependent protease
MSEGIDPSKFERCDKCSVTLSPGTKQCPSCNTPVAQQKSPRSPLKTPQARRHFRHLLIAAILFLLPHVPQVANYIPYRVLFRSSPLVLEAVTRANKHPETEALLGRPVYPGWLARGYIRSDETGWSEGKIWIPVTGVKAGGMLYARGGQADSPWVFSELRLIHDDGRNVDLLAPVQQSSLISPKRHARVYIVPLGGVQGLGLDELPEFYRSRYGISVTLLEPIPLEPSVRNTARNQLIFEELTRLMHARLPHLARDKSAYLIGVTDEDMYIRGNNWNFAYSAYDPPLRAGMVSSRRFIPVPLAGSETLLRARIRKVVSRTMGFVVFDLPRSDDPSSVMYRDLYGSATADLMSDSFEGLGARAVVDEFQAAHGSRPRQPEFLPDVASFDYAKVDGRYPCLKISKIKNSEKYVMTPTLMKCTQGVYLGETVEEIEVDLRNGNLITRTTDLFRPGAIPLAATRCYRAFDHASRTIGRNTTLSWDMFPVGSRQPYTFIEIITCDGNPLRYERISKGTGYADAVYEHRASATSFLGSRFSWNGNGWDLKLRDGSFYLFPESYHGKKAIDGALTGFRDGRGQAVNIERGERRTLTRITSPDRRSIAFEHDSADRIFQAEDDQHQKVSYLYDHGGRLTEVRGKTTVRYAYQDTYLMNIEENGQRVAEFDYDRRGRTSELKLSDGRLFRFDYHYAAGDTKQVVRSIVTSPDGSISKFEIPAQ